MSIVKFEHDWGTCWYDYDGYQHVRHRKDGPAIERLNGDHEWWVNGEEVSQEEFEEMSFCQQVDMGTANERWLYYDWRGNLHRLDGPAIDCIDGYQEWWQYGKLHRLDGPARITLSGSKSWWKDGWRHRTDGPAIERPDGDHEWWVDGRQISQEEFEEMSFKSEDMWPNETERWVDWMHLPHRVDGPAILEEDGSEFWCIHGQKHRIGAPAVIDKLNGYEGWYQDGLPHREDGPAETHPNYNAWRVKGLTHRTDGPAIEFIAGPNAPRKEWGVNGKMVSQEEFEEMSWPHEECNSCNGTTITRWLDWQGELHRIDGPAEITCTREVWCRHGKLHREGGPAYDCFGWFKHWYKQGQLHRTDGPAVEMTDGTKQWWVNGNQVSQEEFEEMSWPHEYEEADGVVTEWLDWQGKRHRLNAPAWENTDGSKMWYRHGESHRVNGPAFEYCSSGYKSWWQDGVFHREDGPAIVDPQGSNSWFIKGQLVHKTSPEWAQLLKTAVTASIATCFLMLQSTPENLPDEARDKIQEIEEEFSEVISEAKVPLLALP